MDQMLWTGVAALVIGALVRAVKSDGATIALANLGLPPVPKRALPWIALALGAASAVLDARVNGTPWEAAAAAGVLSAGGAIVGHDLGKGVPGLGRTLVFVAVITFASSACSLFTRQNARSVLDIAQVTCIIARQEAPESDIAKACGVADDLMPDLRRLLAESRAASARAGASAADGGCAK